MDKSVDKLSPGERETRIKQLYLELKELSATPRDDWHMANENLLRLEFSRYGSKVTIETEHIIGSQPPRADYLVISQLSPAKFEKTIFN